ncbi:hypothetical protein [Paenibacillus cineris]|uniref:Uncharacterized protein n=1 Tax=Paenibacillus cineris TaxID=237530 RepID=A0ABQ4LNA6_9BACL|nr:hypothetical protein [Paenibacillus cineris]GIO57962.1 hypothetical protein J21TS7_62800 [Paenibacillus cineris]
MIKSIPFQNFRYFSGPESDAIVLRRIEREQTIKFSLPFHEDTPNIDLTISEALNLRNALDELIGPIKQLEPPKGTQQDLFPATFISIADQSRLSGLLDEYPTDREADRTARKAIRQAMGLLNLATGGHEY